MNCSVKKITPLVTEVRFKYTKDFEQDLLLISDAHFDSADCDRTLLKKHFDQAVQLNAGIISVGDWYDLMQGKYDPRRIKAGVRPEYNHENYFDLVIQDSADFLSEYSDNLIEFSDGNHCTSILRRLETNPLQRTLDLVKMQNNKCKVQKGQYMGFIRFVFEHESGGKTRTITMAYHHGLWGGIITKGTLSVVRYASIFPDADIVVSGHTHDAWSLDHPRYSIKRNGDVVVSNQLHLKLGTYKECYEKGVGWAVEKLVMPKSKGGFWLHFYYEDEGIKYQAVRAN